MHHISSILDRKSGFNYILSRGNNIHWTLMMTLLEVATSTSAKDPALSMFRRNSTFGGSTIFTLRWMCSLLQIFRATHTHKPYCLRDYFPKRNIFVLNKYHEALLPDEVLPPNYRHWQGGWGGEKGRGEGQDQGAKLDYHPEIEYRSSPGSR